MRTKLRTGILQIEVMVSAVLLTAILGVLATLGHHLNRISIESRQYQMAVHALANQIEVLTAIPADTAQASLGSLQLPAEVTNTLGHAQLGAEWVQDEYGSRVVLSLQWDRAGEPPPLQMVGWLSRVAISNPSTNSGATP
jgi:hypothetical protein